MGGIIFWGIIRTAVMIPALWILYGMMDYKYWWWLGIFSVYGIIIHPAVIQYQIFIHDNNEIINNTLCSSCKHFDRSAILCQKYDQHPTMKQLPCEGMDWEPKGTANEEREVHAS